MVLDCLFLLDIKVGYLVLATADLILRVRAPLVLSSVSSGNGIFNMHGTVAASSFKFHLRDERTNGRTDKDASFIHSFDRSSLR